MLLKIYLAAGRNIRGFNFGAKLGPDAFSADDPDLFLIQGTHRSDCSLRVVERWGNLPAMAELSHLDESNQPLMVDVSAKAETVRVATATCLVTLGRELLSQMDDGELRNKKGPVLQTAILAGITGTKKTSDLIPLCHPLPLDSAKIEITPHDDQSLLVTSTAKTTSRTGVEMEALTGASVAALTLYDMCKAANPAIVISDLKLARKTGGKSDY